MSIVPVTHCTSCGEADLVGDHVDRQCTACWEADLLGHDDRCADCGGLLDGDVCVPCEVCCPDCGEAECFRSCRPPAEASA